MRYQPVGQVVSIVVTGSLNPAIFSPAWLHLNSVINAAEFEAAKIVVIHPEVTDFTVDTLRLQVTAQRFTIISSELPFIRIADLASTIFGSLLPHTPVHQIGFNLQLHFNLESPRQRWTLGRKLAPIEPWGSWGGDLNTVDFNRTGGMRTLAMEEVGPLDGRRGGFRRVTIEPSLLSNELKDAGIFMSVNDHFELDKSAKDTNDLTKTVDEHFDKSIAVSSKIIADMMEFAGGLPK